MTGMYTKVGEIDVIGAVEELPLHGTNGQITVGDRILFARVKMI